MAKTCAKINPSHFTDLISIEEQTLSTDAVGGQTKTWATVSGASALWASIEPTSGYERYQAQKMETPITHKIYMRYMAGINTKQRIIFGSRVFNIIEVINVDEVNAYLEIMAVEGTAT